MGGGNYIGERGAGRLTARFRRRRRVSDDTPDDGSLQVVAPAPGARRIHLDKERSMSLTRTLLVLGLALAATVACSDGREVSTAPAVPPESPAASPPGAPRRPDRLVFLFATALRSPAFRAYIKAQLDASPFPEHKIQLQGFLPAHGRRGLRYLAQENGTSEAVVEREAAEAVPLEVYLPVPAQRAAWTGDENVLVATALGDREAPIAFDPSGRRTVLSPTAPPAAPVIAIVPVETDFTTPPTRVECLQDCGGGGGGGGGNPSLAGLYMTKAHFDDDYEGWLKGNPEFEVHILGQAGTTDSLSDYQCAGERAGGPYTFDQNGNDWSGSVLLFSQQQINNYKAAHPGHSMRVFALEDDDTACKIITNKDDLNRMLQRVDSLYSKRTGGRDTTTSSGKYYKAAKVLRNLWTMVASFIKTNDDIIGTAVEDDVVGAFYPGFGWIVKGQNNITHGWLNLEMR
jgi:hypothetical protein